MLETCDMSGVGYGHYIKGWFSALTSQIRNGWKWLIMTNSQVVNGTDLVWVVKCCIVYTLTYNVVKIFTPETKQLGTGSVMIIKGSIVHALAANVVTKSFP